MIEIPHVLSITPVGSRVTCNPAPMNTDIDWLVQTDPHQEPTLFQWLSDNGWECGGSLPDDMNETPASDRFASFTKGQDNVIVSNHAGFCRRFLAATSIAKRLNLMDKADRIALFQAVLYANADVPTIAAPEAYFA